MNDLIAVKRWETCLMAVILSFSSVVYAIGHVLEGDMGMLLVACIGVIVWTVIGLGFLNKPKIEDESV